MTGLHAGQAGQARQAGMLGLVALAMFTLTLGAQVQDRAEVQLQAAIKLELVDGDLKGAIEEFKKLAQSTNADVAVKALLHMAASYDKLGQPEARGTYEIVVRQYPNQRNAVAEARAWLNAHGATAVEPGRRSVEQIWSGPGVDPNNRLSPDGRYLAFSTPIAINKGDRRYNLVVRDLRTSENRQLTHDATDSDSVETPIWSPDGKQIAYHFGEGPDSTIRVINADGTGMRKLAPDNTGGDHAFLSAWSPDGKTLLASLDYVDGTQKIVLYSTSNGSMTQLKSMPFGLTVGGFSPDGRFILYSMNKRPQDPTTGNGGVFLLAADGTGETRLVEGSTVPGVPNNFIDPVWSPDGRHVVFTSNRSGEPSLWAIRVTNGQPDGSPRRLQAAVGNMRTLGFTRDGSFYYMTSERLEEAYAADFDPDTLTIGKPAVITDRSVGKNFGAELSPDGKYVAFLRRVPGAPISVVIRSLETQREHALTTVATAYGVRPMQWLPDSRSLLVGDAVGGRTKRFRQFDVESGESHVVFEGPWTLFGNALSADGKTLFYSVREEREDHTLRLIKRRLDTGNETDLYRRTVADSPGLFGLVASPDGRQLAFSANTDATRTCGIYTLPVEGGEPKEIAKWGWGDCSEPGATAQTWTSDSRHLVFAHSCGLPRSPELDEGAGHLCVVSTDSGEMKPLNANAAPARFVNLMLPPTGRRVAFSTFSRNREVSVIRNLLSEPATAR